MTATFTNGIKTAVATFINVLKRGLFYLKCEDNTYLLLEDGGKIVIDSGTEFINQTKN